MSERFTPPPARFLLCPRPLHTCRMPPRPSSTLRRGGDGTPQAVAGIACAPLEAPASQWHLRWAHRCPT